MLMFDNAPCRYDPELWFQEDKKSVALTKKLCGTCVHRESCLTDCLDYEELSGSVKYGIFGGLTPRERNQLRAKRA